jgi:hypothetical protein
VESPATTDPTSTRATSSSLTEEGRKAFEAYCANLEELFILHREVKRHGTVLKDTTPIVFNKPKVIPEVWLDLSPSHNGVQVMINSALERQAMSTNELLHRLIEERYGKKLYASSVNPYSSTCAVSFTQTNPHTSGTSTGGTSMPHPSAQPVNHFHSQTTIEGLTTTFGMPHQTTTSMFGQGYTHTTPSFAMPNPGSAPNTPGYNGRAYTNPNGNYQDLYATVAYTNPIPLSGSLLGFFPNHAYQHSTCFNTYGQLETGGFGYETLSQFPFRPQPIDMMPA